MKPLVHCRGICSGFARLCGVRSKTNNKQTNKKKKKKNRRRERQDWCSHKSTISKHVASKSRKSWSEVNVGCVGLGLLVNVAMHRWSGGTTGDRIRPRHSRWSGMACSTPARKAKHVRVLVCVCMCVYVCVCVCMCVRGKKERRGGCREVSRDTQERETLEARTSVSQQTSGSVERNERSRMGSTPATVVKSISSSRTSVSTSAGRRHAQ